MTFVVMSFSDMMKIVTFVGEVTFVSAKLETFVGLVTFVVLTGTITKSMVNANKHSSDYENL